MNLNTFAIFIILTYLGAALAQSLHLFGVLRHSLWRYGSTSLISIIGHGWILYQLIETPFGQNLNWLIMLSFTLWVMNIITFFTGFRTKGENLCIITYPLAALSIALALSFGGMEVVNTKTQPGVLVHIFISLLAVSLLTLASVQALLLGLQNWLLKDHRTSQLLEKFLPLQTMESFLFSIIWSGFLFLSASLASGFIFQHHIFSSFLLHKSLLAVGAWILLTLLLIGRYWFGWRGPTAIRWTLGTTLLTFLSYFGTKALLM